LSGLAVHPRLSVNCASTLRWSLAQDLTFYAEAGVTKVALLMRKVEDAGLHVACELLADAGVVVDNVAAGPCLVLDDRAQWPAGRDRLRQLLANTARLGSQCLVITTGPAGRLTWEEAADALAEALAPIVDEARTDGRSLAVENTNGLRFDLGFLHNLRDTIDVARRLDIGVCMEVNNIWGERGLGETIARGVGQIRTVQVNDFVVGTLATPDRAVPGDGDIPLERIFRQLLAAGYAGPFELEIVGPRIEAEGYPSAVKRSLEFLSGLLESLGA
jgi:sugar phosphate isomerase/epimerase